MQRYNFEIEATGTKWAVSFWSELLSQKDSQALWESCFFVMQDFEKTHSRFRQDSFLSSLSGRTGAVDVSMEMVQMLELYKVLYSASGGLVTPLGGQILSDMGYDASYSFKNKGIDTAVPDFFEVVEIVGRDRIILHQKVNFDLGALGKGFLIDLVISKLKDQVEISRVLVNAGGDIAHWSESGEKARVALENPDDTSEALGVIEIGNEAIASSASNKRRWGKDGECHHIYNPRTRKSTQDIYASWVICEGAALADGIATSLFLVSTDTLRKSLSFESALLDSEGQLSATTRFASAFFVE